MKVIGVLCNIDVDKKRVALHEVGQPHHPVFIMVSKFFTFTVSSNVEKNWRSLYFCFLHRFFFFYVAPVKPPGMLMVNG